jgi:hypothetical protein
VEGESSTDRLLAFRGGPCFTQTQVQNYIDRTSKCLYLAPSDSGSANTTSTIRIPTVKVDSKERDKFEEKWWARQGSNL